MQPEFKEALPQIIETVFTSKHKHALQLEIKEDCFYLRNLSFQPLIIFTCVYESNENRFKCFNTMKNKTFYCANKTSLILNILNCIALYKMKMRD